MPDELKKANEQVIKFLSMLEPHTNEDLDEYMVSAKDLSGVCGYIDWPVYEKLLYLAGLQTPDDPDDLVFTHYTLTAKGKRIGGEHCENNGRNYFPENALNEAINEWLNELLVKKE